MADSKTHRKALLFLAITLASINKYKLKNFLTIFIVISGCSNPNTIDGLWVGDHDRSYLKFSKDSVIVSPSYMSNPAHYNFKGNDITFSWPYPFNKTKTYEYDRNGDSLDIWINDNTVLSYYKSSDSSYITHLKNKGEMKINLPSAESTRSIHMSTQRIIIRAGIISNEVKIFVGNNVSDVLELKDHIQAQIDNQTISPTTAQLIIDEKITMDIIFNILESLRANDVFSIQLVTENTSIQDSFDYPQGLYMRIPYRKTRIKEVNAR